MDAAQQPFRLLLTRSCCALHGFLQLQGCPQGAVWTLPVRILDAAESLARLPSASCSHCWALAVAMDVQSLDFCLGLLFWDGCAWTFFSHDQAST